MPADLADNAAALTAGYVRVQVDRGVSANPRYVSRYEKPVQCDGSSSGLLQVQGDDNTSQANADTEALAALNARRRYVSGTDATNVNKGAKSGATLAVDVY
jgi:hypothetical protein